MKKIVFVLGIFAVSLATAQYYPNNGWGGTGDNSYYGDSPYDYPYYGNDNSTYFPDDYYYEYPLDYYNDAYYKNLYNDYRRSISMVNWNLFFRTNRLAPTQINLIIELNRQFPSFQVWNSYYRMNPKRWWYDRFYALERILGPQVFIVFQNNYYQGYNPIHYYENYWISNYRNRYTVMPQYVRMDVNHYRINRYDYHRSVGTKYGWNQPRNIQSNNASPRTGSFRNYYSDNSYPRSGGFSQGNTNSNPRSGGFSQGNANSNPRSGGFSQGNTNSNPRSGGFSQGTTNSNPRSGGFSQGNTQSGGQRAQGAIRSGNNGGRSGGFR